MNALSSEAFAQDSNNISIVPVYCLLEDKLLQDL
jgi:hypothetical protein